MVTMKLKIARIGNSRGVRLPAASLRRYRIGETVVMEERSEGILLRPTGPTVEKLSWEDTAREMAASREDWSAWEAAVADGLDDVPWEVADKGRAGRPPRQRARSKRR
jgi:antitoxin component of MazEF toxin-antitoxin module